MPFAFAEDTAKKPRTRIIFLGTKGGPRVGAGASNPANAVIVNGTPYVVDCGNGVTRQLARAGISIPQSNTFSSAITIRITISNTATSSTMPGRRASRRRSIPSDPRASKR